MAVPDLRIGLPNVPEGPDMDLDSPHKGGLGVRSESPAKKAKGAPSGGHGSGSSDAVPTMDMLRMLLQEQSQALLQAQHTQLSTALEAFEGRQTERLDKIEGRMDDTTDQVDGLQKQVKELADRLTRVESQPGTTSAGPDRKHTLVFGGWQEGTRKSVLLYQLQQALTELRLSQDLDQEPFCTGARRSVALCSFRRRSGEDEGQLRERMIRILQAVNASKVSLEGAARPLWCSFSKSPAERGKASLAAVVKKAVHRFAPNRASDLDIEYPTGRSWIREDQITGMNEQSSGVRGARQVTTRGGEGWIDERTLAEWLEADVADVRGLIDEHRF